MEVLGLLVWGCDSFGRLCFIGFGRVVLLGFLLVGAWLHCCFFSPVCAESLFIVHCILGMFLVLSLAVSCGSFWAYVDLCEVAGSFWSLQTLQVPLRVVLGFVLGGGCWVGFPEAFTILPLLRYSLDTLSAGRGVLWV